MHNITIKRIGNKIKRSGKKIWNKVLPHQIKDPTLYYRLFQNLNGIEIGGPSSFFNNEIDIYNRIKSLDGVNFSSSTIWGGELTQGFNFQYKEHGTGYQYICDAVDMKCIESSKYDFVLSCNNLEHIANPLKAVSEMLRIIKEDGILLFILPRKSSNFDHKRKITKFDHLLDDYKNNVSEEDLTHLDEILKLHDLSLDSLAGDFGNFKIRSKDNFQNRCLHHHVFNMKLLIEIFGFFRIKILIKDYMKENYIIVGRKM